MIKIKKCLLVHKEVADVATRSALKEIEKMLRTKKISCKKKPVSILLKEDLPLGALVIIVGTDGTFLKTGRYITNQQVICIGIESCLAECTLASFGINELAKLEGIINGEYSQKVRKRLEVSINGYPLDEPVLNEVYFGSEKAYKLSEYEIQFGEARENQKSSGIIIASGTGSTSWFASAGGKPFDCELNEARFLIREMQGAKSAENSHKYLIRYGKITSNPLTKFELTTKKEGMILALDSTSQRYLTKGDKITIALSKTPLNNLCPKV